MSLIWILSGVRQPNYSYLPSDLSQWALIGGRICDFNDVIKPSFPKLMDLCKLAFEIDGLKPISFQNWWTHAISAFELDGLKQISMLSNFDELMNLCIGKLMDSCKLCIGKYLDSSKILLLKSMDLWIYALENWWTYATYALEIDGPMILCIGKLMDSRNLCIGN